MTQEFAFSQTDADHTFTYTNFQGQPVTQTRTVTGTVFTPDAPGTYPVVFYSHGHFGTPTGGAAVNARALAEQGYIVIAPRHLDSLDYPAAIRSAFPLDEPSSTLHRIADIRFLFDILPELMAGAPGFTADASRAAIAGHSHGAFTAALLAGAQSFKPGLEEVVPGNEFGLTEIADDRFAEAILLSPQGALGADTTFGFTENSWDGVTISTLTVTGTEDNGSDGMTYRDRLDGFEHGPSGGKHAFVLSGADHGQIGGGDTADPAINAEVAEVMTAFLDAYVKDDAAALAMLADVAAYADAHPLLFEAYERSQAGAAGSGVVRGDSGDNDLEGLSTDDAISGRGGDDTLDGGLGADRLHGNAGDDSLNGGGKNDSLTGGGGNDTVLGGGNNDNLQGNAGNDAVKGGGGDDLLRGGAGDDKLNGDAGADTLRGEGGEDRLIGGAGPDVFDFNFVSDSPFGPGADAVTDFGAGDQVDLKNIDANTNASGNQSFILISGGFTGDERELRFVTNGTNGRLLGDTDGDGSADLLIILNGVTTFHDGDLIN